MRKGGSIDASHLVRPIAHRGLHVKSAGRIENTASAFEAAIAKGYGIECDLQPAEDNTPIVFHDATLQRLTDAKGPVKAHTRAALKRIALKGTKDRILSLPEFLELVGGRVPMLIEIKSDWTEGDAFVQAIAKELRSYKGAYGVMSFDPRRVAPLAELLPGIPRGITAGGIRRDPHVVYWLKRWNVAKLWHNDLLTPDFLAYYVKGLPAASLALRKRPKGMPLFTWTVRSPTDRAKAARHADAMIFEGFEPETPAP